MRLILCILAILAPFLDTRDKVMAAPRELLVLMFIIFLTSFGGSGASAISAGYFSDEFDYSDVDVGALIALGSVSFLICGVIVGRYIDRIGVKRTIVTAGVIGAISGSVYALAWNNTMIILNSLVIMPLSMAFAAPVTLIAIKRWTNQDNSRVAFMLAYVMVNIGASFSYLFLDFVRYRFDGMSSIVVFRTYSTTAARIIFFTSALTSLFASLIASCSIRDIYVDTNGSLRTFVRTPEVIRVENASEKTPWGAAFTDPNFYRVSLFAFIMVPLFAMFTDFDMTFPTAAVRNLGDDVLFGTIKATNPIIIIVLQMPISHLFKDVHIYTVMLIGCAIAACGTFIFCAPMTYTSAVLAFAFFTLGEMIFSHRTQDFSQKFMPHGHEGIYSAMSSICIILPTFGTRALSGWLLSELCPESGERRCELMWLIIGLRNCLTVIGLLLARRYLLKGYNVEKKPTEMIPKFEIRDVDAEAPLTENDY